MTPPDSPADSPAGITAQQIADVLIKGERERKEVPQFSDSYPDIDVATAYRAQKAFVKFIQISDSITKTPLPPWA